jgi:hypothetical protein
METIWSSITQALRRGVRRGPKCPAWSVAASAGLLQIGTIERWTLWLDSRT